MEQQLPFSVVSFGETLWDVTPAGAFPGGAPMNVAYHLNKLSVRTALISRVGIDRDGEKIISLVDRFGLSTEFFQLDYELATGKVLAHVDSNGDATYDIVHPVAWDHIEYLPALSPLVRSAPYFLFGTLAARNKASRATLMQLLQEANTKVLDLNLRSPWYNRELLSDFLALTDILKLNTDELELITGWFSHYTKEVDRIKALKDRFSLSHVLLTRGRHGALVNQGDRFWEHPGFRVDVADTVGSGDAFTAGILSGLIHHKDMEETLDFANRVAAFVTTRQGACPEYTIDQVL